MSLAQLLERHREAGVFSHAYAAYGRLAERDPRVVARVGPDGRGIFDLASLTKALVTVPLLFEQGLSFAGTVFDWSPSLESRLKPELGRLRINDLLRHEAGLPSWRNFWVCRLGRDLSPDYSLTWMKRFEVILEVLNRVEVVPQGRQLYSDVGFILLGLVLETRHALDLRQQFLRFGSDLVFLPSCRLDCIPSAFCPVRQRLLFGEPHDENCAALGGVAGHCGLFGTGSAICHFLHDYFYLNPVGRQVLSTQLREVKATPPLDPTQDSLMGWRQG